MWRTWWGGAGPEGTGDNFRVSGHVDWLSRESWGFLAEPADYKMLKSFISFLCLRWLVCRLGKDVKIHHLSRPATEREARTPAFGRRDAARYLAR